MNPTLVPTRECQSAIRLDAGDQFARFSLSDRGGSYIRRAGGHFNAKVRRFAANLIRSAGSFPIELMN